jgi:hypothetical protein
MTNESAYDLYVNYCDSVGCTPATFEKWVEIERNPVEYDKASTPVDSMMYEQTGSRSPAFGLWPSA